MTDGYRTIYRYSLDVEDVQAINVPSIFKPLHVGHVGGRLFLWAEVEFLDFPDAVACRRLINIYGTGNPRTGKDKVYIGTVQMPCGLVWHVYDGGFA